MKKEHLEPSGNILKEPSAVYNTREELEDARLREDISRTPTEKFYFLMRLMKISEKMRKATIFHKKG